jgi:adenylate kinase family enzyme
MHRIVIFGNSGSGKSTLAREKAERYACPHLDLDTVAWDGGAATPTRKPLDESKHLIAPFLSDNRDWVVEGCYADLLNLVIPHCTEMIFLNPGIEICRDNCRKRPWEPHKYESQAAQDGNLDMLLSWIEQYESREDEFSLPAHRRLFDAFKGLKREYTSNDRSD